MKRLYYLFRGTDAAGTISRDLAAVGINAGQMHFLNNDKAALDSAHVHRTGVFEERDIPHRGTWGAIMGFGIGLLFGTYLMASDLGTYMSMGIFLLVCLMFTAFGAWVGGFVGIANNSHHLTRFQSAIADGDTLLMVDTYTEDDEARLKQVMHTRHMEASYEGEENNFKVYL